MPAWETVRIKNPAVSLKASPSAWWRKGPLNWLPFMYGSKPTFKLTITANEDLKDETVHWFVESLNGHKRPVAVALNMDKGASITIDAGGDLLGFSGDTFFGVRGPNKNEYAQLYVFRVTPFEDIARDLFLGFLLVILAFTFTFFTRGQDRYFVIDERDSSQLIEVTPPLVDLLNSHCNTS